VYALTSKNILFEWNLEHKQIREIVISILTNEPELIIFDTLFMIGLQTDAGADGYGAIYLFYSLSYELETLAVYVSTLSTRCSVYGV